MLPTQTRVVAGVFALVVAITNALACAPIVRPAPFRGASDKLTDASLAGPFDGQVVDATTSKPIQDATVLGVWSYDQGDGFIGPAGSRTAMVETDAAGRYRIPRTRDHARGRHAKLVSFRLLVYKRGYAAYRSDARFGAGARIDFTARHNEVALRKWAKHHSHASHLLFLAPPPELAKRTRWEVSEANWDLYRAVGGTATNAARQRDPAHDATDITEPDPPPPLDAEDLLTATDIFARTGQTHAFESAALVDMARSAHYHGVHLRAVDLDETFDVSFRVWRNPPGGFEAIVETFRATLPGVEVSDEVTDETWIADLDAVRAVGFIDRDAAVAVLITCGISQCADVATAIILGKFAHANLDRLRPRVAPEAGLPPATATPTTPETTPTTPETTPTTPETSPAAPETSPAAPETTPPQGDGEPRP
ncbi:MAG: hypothetical protein V3V08_12080 [Nannocystaceae bacterium]